MTSLIDTARQGRPRHPRAWLAGVCAELADRFALPVWLPRVGAVILFHHFPWETGPAYLILAVTLRTRLAALLPPPAPRAARQAPPDPGHMLQRDRFAALEQRLARLEAAVTSDELKLRARFRDLGA